MHKQIISQHDNMPKFKKLSLLVVLSLLLTCCFSLLLWQSTTHYTTILEKLNYQELNLIKERLHALQFDFRVSYSKRSVEVNTHHVNDKRLQFIIKDIKRPDIIHQKLKPSIKPAIALISNEPDQGKSILILMITCLSLILIMILIVTYRSKENRHQLNYNV